MAPCTSANRIPLAIGLPCRFYHRSKARDRPLAGVVSTVLTFAPEAGTSKLTDLFPVCHPILRVSSSLLLIQTPWSAVKHARVLRIVVLQIVTVAVAAPFRTQMTCESLSWILSIQLRCALRYLWPRCRAIWAVGISQAMSMLEVFCKPVDVLKQ